jgi:acetyl esterase/lipase
MKRRAKPRLIAVDGTDAGAMLAAARRALGSPPSRGGGGISHWDASGVFQDLAVADDAAGAPSPRTLLLLYAADLAFRLRWEIKPAMAEGHTVVAAPYVETAVAFGRAAGVPAGWLENLFRFAPRPTEHCFAHRAAKRGKHVDGFVRFGCACMRGKPGGRTPKQILSGAAVELRKIARRKARPDKRETQKSRS